MLDSELLLCLFYMLVILWCMTRSVCHLICWCSYFFFQAEDGIRDLVRSRGLGDVYKRQELAVGLFEVVHRQAHLMQVVGAARLVRALPHLLHLSLIHI